ncbi:co-chaperone HscB [Shewanella violacea]|uniref:Co-chaperone protein HscB homolog n=1 Tax=Shewanella violacea (strain JCM 10179 / CIP 106290 / LMG 19151 / DSS12) TaxID=637905 RepID=D4ZIR6_SHEVD|nr:co-chaperone HscB [Shewanella violacea]BAJ01565.1 co-chaperone Hsc20 [Shewanella violacea DSS12]
MNYFELFSLTPSFDIDTALLADRYHELQRAVHPDKFANSSEQDKRIAVQRTAQVNDGFSTLKNPLSRAEHILALAGIDLSHESTTVKDTQFLMQQMEWRESLEDIAHCEDPDAMIAELYDSFNEYSDSISQNLAGLLLSHSESDLASAADLIRKLKFMAKLQVELERIEDAQFD